jgi:hypothetical protein
VHGTPPAEYCIHVFPINSEWFWRAQAEYYRIS